jgi:hypothetical protein
MAPVVDMTATISPLVTPTFLPLVLQISGEPLTSALQRRITLQFSGFGGSRSAETHDCE